MEPLKRPKGRNINTSGALALLNKSVRAGRYIDSPSHFFLCAESLPTSWGPAEEQAHGTVHSLLCRFQQWTVLHYDHLHDFTLCWQCLLYIEKKKKNKKKTSKRSFSIDILYTVKKKKPDRPSASSFQARSFLCVLCRPYVYVIICCEPSAGKPESVLLTEANSHQK